MKSLSVAIAVAVSVGSVALIAAAPTPGALAGWAVYISATERRIGAELGARRPFLASDFTSDAPTIRQLLRRGAIPIDRMRAKDQRGHDIEVPAALLHHWRGAVLLPRATLAGVMEALETRPPPVNDDVLRSAILGRESTGLRVFLRLRRSQVVTVVFDTEHLVTFTRVDDAHATSISIATRIAEVADPGTPNERELAPSEDHGFLWRWHAYWRYEAVRDGVIAECESISLSRSAPPVVGPLIQPLVDRAARESMERALVSLRDRFANGH